MADATKDKKGSKKTVSRKKRFLVIGLVFLIAAAAFAAYLFVQSKRPATIETSNLPVEIIAFSFQRLPGLYQTLLDLDDEITRTEGEITRIETVGTTYPDQKKIADTEVKSWTANLAALKKGQADFEKQIEVLYVSVQVNPETGQALIAATQDELKQKTEQVIARSKTLTDKLRAIEEARSFFEKTRDRLFKK